MKIEIGSIWKIKQQKRTYPEFAKIQDIYYNDTVDERVDIMFCKSCEHIDEV